MARFASPVLLLTLTGCVSAAPDGADAALGLTTPTITSRTPPMTPPRTPSTNQTRASTSPQPRPASPCDASALAISTNNVVRGQGQRPDGQFAFATDFVVRNNSARACTLDGWVGVSAYGSGVVNICQTRQNCERYPDKTTPQPVKVSDRPGSSRIVLHAQGRTVFSIVWEGAICVRPPYRLDFEVPGDTRPISTVLPKVCLSPLQVTSFGTLA
jgi:hypothetical protein